MDHTVIKDKILELVHQRGAGKTICPSDVARSLQSDEAQWRKLMTPIRQTARHMAQAGEIGIYRKGKWQDPHGEIKGVIRLGIVRQD